MYDLSGTEAGKTGEAQGGIVRLAGLSGELPEALSRYLSLVRESGRIRIPARRLSPPN